MTTLSAPPAELGVQHPQPDSARSVLLARLAELQQQRAQAEAESVPPGSGDLADRSSNVEALIRLETVEARIVALELRLDDLRWQGTQRPGDASVAQVGSRVTVRFGTDDIPETFHLESIEEAQPDAPVITPESPLGQALLGARPGQLVTYRAGGATRTAELLDVAG